MSHVANDGALSQRALSQRRGRNGPRKGVRKGVDEDVRGSACFQMDKYKNIQIYVCICIYIYMYIYIYIEREREREN